MPDKRRHHGIGILCLCAVTLLAYSNSFGTGFALDNAGLILNDARVHDATSQNVALIFQHSYWWPIGEAGLYRPLTTLSYLFNYAILGDGSQPSGYHWINFLLHLANVLMVYMFATKLFSKFWPALLLAALWAVHPASTESVTNIIGRSDLLAGVATLGGLLAYVKSTEASGGRRVAWLAALCALTAVGVFSKESAVTLLGVVVLYEITWWKERRPLRSLALGCAAMLIPILAMLYQRSLVLGASPPAEFPFTDNPIAGADFWTGRLTALSVIPRYLRLTIWPANLSADYSFPQIPLASGLSAWIGVAIALALLAGIAWLYRGNRAAFFLAGFAAVTFLPVSNLLFPIGTIMADRFLYLPSLGILGCVVLGVYAGLERFKAARFAPVILGAIVLAFAARTWARNPDWQDDSSLAAATVRSSPKSYKAHRLQAQILFQADPAHSNIGQAIEEADRSVALLDSLPDDRNAAAPYRLAASYYLSKGDQLFPPGAASPPPAAMQAFERGVRIAQRAIAIDEAGRAAYRQRAQSQITSSGAKSGLTAGDAEGYRLLASFELRLGNLDPADAATARAQAIDPLDPEGYRLSAQVRLARGRTEDAAITLMTGMLVTSDPGLRQALLRLYQSGLDPRACAIGTGPNGPTLNSRCETVRQQLCAASVRVLQIRLQAGQRDRARADKRAFLQDNGCPAAPLDQVLPDKSGS